MMSRDFAILVYSAIVAVAFVLELLSRRTRSRIPSLSTLFRTVMRTRPGRVGLIAGWAWLGLHFFAR
ncbi:MAG TPA: DUF6186 family protein [Actinomycetota bacterium]|nr:DUF6186 family protein [Actinomycetota bacterium]